MTDGAGRRRIVRTVSRLPRRQDGIAAESRFHAHRRRLKGAKTSSGRVVPSLIECETLRIYKVKGRDRCFAGVSWLWRRSASQRLGMPLRNGGCGRSGSSAWTTSWSLVISICSDRSMSTSPTTNGVLIAAWSNGRRAQSLDADHAGPPGGSLPSRFLTVCTMSIGAQRDAGVRMGLLRPSTRRMRFTRQPSRRAYGDEPSLLALRADGSGTSACHLFWPACAQDTRC